MTPWFNHTKLI